MQEKRKRRGANPISEQIRNCSAKRPKRLKHFQNKFERHRLAPLIAEVMCIFRGNVQQWRTSMAQASVLTDSDIRRVFRIVETTRHAERNRLAFILSIYAGMRIGEIAALTVRDVATAQGEVRREIKLSSEQTKGSKGRTVILSERVRREIAAQLKNRLRRPDYAPLIASQRNGRRFSNVSLSMLFKELYDLAGIRTSSHSGRRTFATRLNEKGVGMKTIQRLMGHKNIATTALYCEVSETIMRNAVELI
jgi:integrase/recombinase XerD